MSEELVALGWSDDALPLHTHVCFTYSDEGTMRRTLAFIRVGLETPGDFCAILADQGRHRALAEQLQEGYAGDVQADLAAGRLALINGAAMPAAFAKGLAARLDAALLAGFARIRVLALLGWGLPGWPGTAELKRYEAAVNRAVARYPAVAVCTYHVPRLPGEVLLESGLGAHHMVQLDDRLVGGGHAAAAEDTDADEALDGDDPLVE